MMASLERLLAFFIGDPQSDRVVPPSGFTVRLTLFSAAAMAFLACFALALSLATGRLAERWSSELAQTATIRISAPTGEVEAQTAAVDRILGTTPGVVSARVLTDDEQAELLRPWLGADLPLEALPVPTLIEVVRDPEVLDLEGLRLRLAGEVPGAVLDDHTRWREPLVRAAARLRALGWLSLILITGATAAMITLAAQAALSANRQVIHVMRQVGAQDSFIARAFVRRFTLRALSGAAVGALVAMIAIAALPATDAAGGILTGLGFRGVGWLAPAAIPPLVAMVAYVATRVAAFRTLREMA